MTEEITELEVIIRDLTPQLDKLVSYLIRHDITTTTTHIVDCCDFIADSVVDLEGSV